MTPTITELKKFFAAVDNDEVGDLNWQANAVAYRQLYAETTMGTFTVETWFADAERQKYGWPQAIIADYEKYQQKLTEAKQEKQDKSALEVALAEMRAELDDLRKRLTEAPAAEETAEPEVEEPATDPEPEEEAEDEAEEDEAAEEA